VPVAHSLVALHTSPSAFLVVHEPPGPVQKYPAAQSVIAVQVVRQVVAPQVYGAGQGIDGWVHVPLPLQ
jgi:hypothetical protein